MNLSDAFSPVSYSALPGWEDDDLSAAYAAFVRCAHQAKKRAYKSGSLGIEVAAFERAYAEARDNTGPLVAGEARAFFERHFLPCQVRPETGDQGFVTGFFEPEAQASPVRTERFNVPIYCPPGDLVKIGGQDRPAALDPTYAYGRREGDTLVAYHDREAIERGALVGRGLELCWLADRVDAFFIHVQGAARLKMTDGGEKRITYAAKSGHPFTGIGGVLAGLGEIPREQVTMQTIRAWLARNPGRQDEILWRNRSFIFFEETSLGDPALGPVAAAKVQLSAGRSIAVDRLLHSFGTPFFIDAPVLSVGGAPFRRLMIAQDTGSAITGPARGDLFIGTGDAAGAIAGTIRHPASFYVLVPRALVPGAAR